ncbi:MAG: PAS domain S-box protein [Desulfomonile tiedjei]|nr:PAS domain S-box protein [Desulfomonile tiedjei]
MGKSIGTGPARGLWVALLLVITLALLAGCYAYYRFETERIRQEKYQEIAAIGKLKAGQIQDWRQERLKDLWRSVRAPFFKRAVEEWLQNPDNAVLQADLMHRLVVEQKEEGYSDVLLLDPQGRVLLSSTPQPHPMNPAAEQVIEEALAKGTPLLGHLYRCPKGIVHMDSVGPILGQDGRPIGVLLLRSNAESLLYPLIQSWPTLSRTAETLLVRREGEDLLFLNDLRHRPNTALSLRKPLTLVTLPSVQAVLGKQGIFQGQDYRGVEVLADLRPIPESPWFMVAKVDASEILAEAGYRGGVIALFAALFILIAAGVTAHTYRYRQVRLYRDLYRSERETRVAHQEFRTTLYSIGDAVITTDTAGLVKQMNPVAEKLTGWLEAEAKGRLLDEIFRIVNEDSRTKVENPVRRVLREGTVVGLANHTLLIARDGTEHLIADSGAPIREDGGAISGVVLVFRDQTREQEAQNSLRESERRLAQIIQFLPDATFVVDSQGKVIGWNRAITEMTGVKVDDIVGKGNYEYALPFYGYRRPVLIDLVMTPDLAIANQYVSFRQEADRLVSETYLADFRGRGPTWLWNTATPLYDQDGKVVGAIESIRDISDLKTAEAALRTSEAQLSNALDIAHLGHWEYDVTKDLFIFNDHFYKIFRTTAEQVGGYTMSSAEYARRFVHPDDISVVGGEIRKAIEATDPHFSGQLEHRFLYADGEIGHISVRHFIVKDDLGTTVKTYGVNQDVTELKRAGKERQELESQLQQAHKMEAVGTLAGGVAHDFNNLLQVVLGYSDFALTDESLTPATRDDLMKINRAARSGADLVQQLLMFSRKAEPKPRALNLNHEIQRVRKMLSRTIPKMISIEWHLEDELAVINGDPTQIEQILLNLAVNARDAMPDGGKLTIQTENVVLDEDYCRTHIDVAPGQYVLLKITDTGKGMDRTTVSRIFEPFFTTKGVSGGTGLGLAVVYGIVKQHGGRIACYSEPGEGTAFRIYLPALEGPLLSEETSQRSMPAGGTETILMVDDEDLVRELGARILTKAGYTVLTAGNGKDALEVYQKEQNRIALVVLDLIMPEMGGRQCLEEILRLNPAGKVLIASGYSANGRTKETMEIGAAGFVAKPYDVRQLLEMVRNVLDS